MKYNTEASTFLSFDTLRRNKLYLRMANSYVAAVFTNKVRLNDKRQETKRPRRKSVDVLQT